MATALIDLLLLDREISRVVARVEKSKQSLPSEDEERPSGTGSLPSSEPFGELRHVSTQTTFRALSEQKTSAHETLHKDALLRWIYELLQTRIGWDLLNAEMKAAKAVDPSLPQREKEREGGELLRTWEDAHRALVHATHEAGARIALDRMVALAPPIAAPRRERRERRLEAARRLGLEHPDALATTAPQKVVPLAKAILDATEPLAKEIHRERAKRGMHVIRDAFAEDAREGWPAKLGARWLEDVFAALVQRPMRAPDLPPALGGASFARAAATWGRTLRLAGTARSLPFALARDPYADDAHRFGCTLAFAVAGRLFAKKALNLTARAGDAHARAIGRALFFTLRLDAFRILLGTMEWEELGARVLGTPLPASLQDAWPVARDAEPSRFIGSVAAHAFSRELEERFDEDWFVNPKAGAHLATIAAGPVWNGVVPEVAVAEPIARRWEEAIG